MNDVLERSRIIVEPSAIPGAREVLTDDALEFLADLHERFDGRRQSLLNARLERQARFGREVVDRVRVDQANTLRAEPKARQVIKRSRWLLLRNRDNLKAEQAVKLEELLAAIGPGGLVGGAVEDQDR